MIPLSFRYENEYILFKSWNLFVIVCALPSIIIATLLIKMPESPKFLLNKGKHDETIECLKVVYSWNNNKGLGEFPVSNKILNYYRR